MGGVRDEIVKLTRSLLGTNYSIPAFGSNNNLYIAVYWGFSIAQTIGTFVLGLVFAFVSTAAARSIHKKGKDKH